MPRSKSIKREKSSSPAAVEGDVFPMPSLNDANLRMSYEIARGEQGVLTFEPYKGILLKHWRFRTVPIAEESSQKLEEGFKHYVEHGDLVGADMARKFIQMGMTRAKRYANHAGGKKYNIPEREIGKGTERVILPKSDNHAGRDEKLQASEVFKVVWRRCIEDEGYLKLKAEWQKEKKAWLKNGGGEGTVVDKRSGQRFPLKKEEKEEDKKSSVKNNGSMGKKMSTKKKGRKKKDDSEDGDSGSHIETEDNDDYD